MTHGSRHHSLPLSSIPRGVKVVALVHALDVAVLEQGFGTQGGPVVATASAPEAVNQPVQALDVSVGVAVVEIIKDGHQPAFGAHEAQNRSERSSHIVGNEAAPGIEVSLGEFYAQ